VVRKCFGDSHPRSVMQRKINAFCAAYLNPSPLPPTLPVHRSYGKVKEKRYSTTLSVGGMSGSAFLPRESNFGKGRWQEMPPML
jgi:hypothetical protein